MKIKPLHPLISCICITNNRPEMLLKSILSFDQQNYPNTELIISYPKTDLATREAIFELQQVADIRILEIEREEDESMGTARNNAVTNCNGTYVCMWDDDDIYFFTRIADQYNLLQGGGRYFQASIISHIVLFDATQAQAYLSFQSHWEGSLLCKKEHFLQYPCTDTNQFECRPVIDYLTSRRLLLDTGFVPQLYIYVYHGTNVIEDLHFQYLLKKSQPLEEGFSRSIQAYLDQKIKITIS